MSFEVTDAAPGVPPELFMGGTDVSAAGAVAARQFRIACLRGVEDVESTIAAQRDRWEAAGIESYEYSMSWMQFNDLAGDYTLTVIDGQPRRVVRADGVELDAERLAGRLPTTIDEVFDAIENHVTADAFIATYDPRYGFPVDIRVDNIAEAVDDELEIRISGFTLDPAIPAITAGAVEIGRVVEATSIDWSTMVAEQGSWHWLLVDASDGTIVDGSSRLALGISPG